MPWFRSERERVADDLQTLYLEYRRLAKQLADDAERAPYPHMTAQLKELHSSEEQNALTVSTRLAELGRHADENGLAPSRVGKNAWDRMMVLLEEYRDLIRQLKALWVRWDDEHPEDASLMATLRDNAQAHRAVISDLVARSDPHAID